MNKEQIMESLLKAQLVTPQQEQKVVQKSPFIESRSNIYDKKMAGEQPTEDADQQLVREYEALQTLEQKLVHQNWKIWKMAYFEMGQIFLNTDPDSL